MCSIKRRFKKIMSIGLTACIFALLISGCGEANTETKKYRSVKAVELSSQVVASNNDYELSWDNDGKCVLLKSLKTGKVWSDILYDEFLDGSISANANSPLLITVANTTTLTWDTLRSYTEMEEDGNIVVKKIKNGIRVAYFFNKYKITVPVDYELREDSVKVSIDGSQILEDGIEYKLVSATLDPMFCSVKNGNDNSYIFVPSGCGAIMNTAETAEGTRKYTGDVYGNDVAAQIYENYNEKEDIKLPVFGIKDNDTAMCGIIEEGAPAAAIEAQAGNGRLGYSNVGATFYFRCYDTFRYKSHGTGNVVSTRVSENHSTEKVSVGFYPLYDEDAGYNGMAKLYKNYLTQKGLLKKAEMDAPSYGITFLGGTSVADSFLGIPKNKLVALSEYDKIQDVICTTQKDVGTLPTIRLKNFGKNGLLPGEIADSDSFSKVYGTAKELNELQKINPNMFVDLEVVYFKKSGNGFSIRKDAAKTATKYLSTRYPTTPLRDFDEDLKYSVIARNSLPKAINKVIKKVNKYELNGVSLSSLGRVKYSDTRDEKYNAARDMETQVSNLLKTVKKEKIRVGTENANGYAAALSDAVFDVTGTNGNERCFDYQVPFYQMVFHSYVSLYSEPINLSENPDKTILFSAVSGMGLGFTLTTNHIVESTDNEFYPLYGTYCEDWQGKITDYLNNGFKEIYEKTSNSEIISYELPVSGISKTVFSNGAEIYANHTEKKLTSPVGELKPFEFKLK